MRPGGPRLNVSTRRALAVAPEVQLSQAAAQAKSVEGAWVLGCCAPAVWAPTAQSVELLWFKSARGGQATPLPMQPNVLGPGVWSAELPDGALWTYYKYR